jgi:hypothetical protein
MLYTWTIAHLDRDGRISGNPSVICAQVAPLIAGVDPDLVRSTLAKAHMLGLVDVYDSEGKTWVAYPKFEKNQQGMRYDREASGVAPAPSGVAPEWIRQLPAESKAKETKVSKEKRKKQTPVDLATASPTARGDQTSDIKAIFSHYRTYHPRAHPKPKSSSKEWRDIKNRLADGYSVDDLKTAIDGCHASAFHQGENDRNKKYDSLDLIMRDSSHVSQFIEEHAKRDEPVMSEKERRGKRAGEQWLKMREDQRDAER